MKTSENKIVSLRQKEIEDLNASISSGYRDAIRFLNKAASWTRGEMKAAVGARKKRLKHELATVERYLEEIKIQKATARDHLKLLVRSAHTDTSGNNIRFTRS